MSRFPRSRLRKPPGAQEQGMPYWYQMLFLFNLKGAKFMLSLPIQRSPTGIHRHGTYLRNFRVKNHWLSRKVVPGRVEPGDRGAA